MKTEVFAHMQTMPVPADKMFVLDFDGGLIRKVVGLVIAQDKDGEMHTFPVTDCGYLWEGDDTCIVSTLNHGCPLYKDLMDSWIQIWGAEKGKGSEADFLAYVQKVGLPIIHGASCPI